MGSSGRRRRAAVAPFAMAAGLVAAGGVLVRACELGFWGTVTVAALIATWLAVLLGRAATRVPRAFTEEPDGVAEDGDGAVLHLLLDEAPGPLLALDGARVRALNRAARRLFATDDLVLPPPPALVAPDATRLRHGGRSWRIDRARVDGPGFSAMLVALVDVEAAEHAAQARATRELLRVLGHEVMNAMAPIASLAESALDVLDAPERRDRLLPDILGTLARRADGLRRFTQAYRQMARLPDPALAPVSVGALLADVARLFEGEWRDRAVLRIAARPELTVTADRDQLTQALLALLRNAAEAPRTPGSPNGVGLDIVADERRWCFLVSDNGAGVAPADRVAIFTPFFTTKPDGNGIGLAAARQIAQAHGGQVVLRPAAPTTFELSLPR